MAINYSLNVSKCEVYPSKNSKSNVVHTVHWRLTAIDDANKDSEGEPQRSTTHGVQEVDTSDLSSFINWSDLTAAQVQGWVEISIGSKHVSALKAQLDANIAKKIAPTSVSMTLS